MIIEAATTLTNTDITATHANITIPVHLTDWINSRYLVEGYNGQAKVFRSEPATVRSHMIDSIGYIKASNTDAHDFFGDSVALSADGQTLAVGAPAQDNVVSDVGDPKASITVSRAGAVYVYARSGQVWMQQAYITASNADSNDRFGTCVALSADGLTLVVGFPQEDSSASGVDGDQRDNTAENAGAVHVYAYSDSVWSQQAYIKASNANAHDFFGGRVTVSADGQTLAVGAAREDGAGTGLNGDQGDNTAESAGAVYIYARTGPTWVQQAYLKASNTEAYDFFGDSVALSADGQTLAVGAPWEGGTGTYFSAMQSDRSPTYSGAVYVYTRSGSTWTPQANLKGWITGAYDFFGSSVALSVDGQSLVVGAPGGTSTETDVVGGWRDNPATRAGAVYVYARTGSTWIPQAYLNASNANPGDDFGSSVALSANGQTLAVGARWEDSAAIGVAGDQADNRAALTGAVYLFSRTEAIWMQPTYLKASNTNSWDRFGTSLALSADGQSLAVGAPWEASAATEIDGEQRDNTAPQSGAVYLY